MDNRKIEYPDYPGLGQKCNGCGMCCMLTVCQIGETITGITEGPCPLLLYGKQDKRFICGALTKESKKIIGQETVSAFSSALGIGRGCDSEILEQEAKLVNRFKDAVGWTQYKQ